jgi:hypothetical protein
MDKELALHIVRTAFRSAAALDELFPLLQHNCGDEEAKAYGLAIASAVAHIHRELTNRVFSSLPELQVEVETQIRKYGRVL